MDDRLRTHPKIVRAGLSGWLFVCGIWYCCEHLTDGLIPREAVPMLAPGLPTPEKHAARLVEIGLWREHADGYEVHDFLEWNKSRAEVGVSRSKWREKKRGQRTMSPGDIRESPPGNRARVSGGVPRGHGWESPGSRAYTYAPGAGMGSPLGSQGLGSGGEGEGERERGRERAAPLIDGAAIRRHGTHRRCYPDRGLCVTPWVWDELVGRLGGLREDAEDRLRDWMDAEVRGLGDAPVGDAPDDFWRKRFAGWVGVAPKPGAASHEGRGERTARVYREVAAKLAGDAPGGQS
jgi:hypothetical protein